MNKFFSFLISTAMVAIIPTIYFHFYFSYYEEITVYVLSIGMLMVGLSLSLLSTKILFHGGGTAVYSIVSFFVSFSIAFFLLRLMKFGPLDMAQAARIASLLGVLGSLAGLVFGLLCRRARIN